MFGPKGAAPQLGSANSSARLVNLLVNSTFKNLVKRWHDKKFQNYNKFKYFINFQFLTKAKNGIRNEKIRAILLNYFLLIPIKPDKIA